MAIPNYTYLKLKMSGPNNIITMGSTFLHAYTCDREHYELATTVINSAELPELGNSLTLAVPNCNEPTSSSAFHPTEETKVVGIDPADPTKTGESLLLYVAASNHVVSATLVVERKERDIPLKVQRPVYFVGE
ncbi:uncharacterized protein, partial [Miscanthus floridulus]|uniref:uncharacterized protein n=1 Tax=Miscanthus floridulus TaxID=154761 RepID=UPI0034598146